MEPAEEKWIRGYGMIHHSDETIARVQNMLQYLSAKGMNGDGIPAYEALAAADRIASAAMWLVVHCTYAKNIYLDGHALTQKDFKIHPEGHTGGALNIVPGYVGYMLMNVLMGKTRAWTMEQGHTVNAIDSVNLILGNMTDAHASRYSLTDQGLSRFTQDFYSFKINDQGKQDSPVGSHVNHNTAGGFIEGGYLGFTGVQYVHIPLPHERLVVFLSDGAFEEQRGGDWAPRFWRAEDSGLVVPIMIANGRRIDQRSTLSQEGGAEWLSSYLKIHKFDPIVFDGRDPAAFAWAIFEIEHRLKQYVNNIDSVNQYPVLIPFGIASAPKGAGFYGEGTNAAHNLPLVTNPYEDDLTRDRFNVHAKKLWVPEDELKQSVSIFQHHENAKRIKEKDHQIAHRNVNLEVIPKLPFLDIAADRGNIASWVYSSPISAIDKGFVTAVRENPKLRARVGNPDEMRSNRMNQTLEELKFRVPNPEGGNTEATLGKIITVLNEEAIAGAAFGNKGGINIIVTYEAFGAKIFGEARQEVIFAQHQKEAGDPAKWLSVPLVLASHTWENCKNEQSHQDPSMAESMLGETSDISRVLFPPDYNTGAVIMRDIYTTHGEIWTIVASKRKIPDLFTKEESEVLLRDGGIRLPWFEYKPEEAKLSLMAIGAYQLSEVLKAASRLRDNQIPYTICYIQEPGKFRYPRNEGEKSFVSNESIQKSLLPDFIDHIICSVHTRPEVIAGVMLPFFGKRNLRTLGFINQGGTFDIDGMLYMNKCSWAHIIEHARELLQISRETVLSQEEQDALDCKRSPDGILKKAVEI